MGFAREWLKRMAMADEVSWIRVTRYVDDPTRPLAERLERLEAHHRRDGTDAR